MQRLERSGLPVGGMGARFVAALTAAVILTAIGPIRHASAQLATPVDSEFGNVHRSGASTLLDLSTRFMRHLGNEAAGATAGPPLVNNPGGGGADSDMARRYRAWFEGYGLASKMKSEGDFAGDRRNTWGGVAGIGYTPMPGLSLGASVDQSRTKIDVTNLPQNATIDLTQVGVNASVESGAWTFGMAGIYGFGRVKSNRDDTGGTVDTASYDAKMWGLFGEVSYLIALGDARIVPKAGVDWARSETGAFTETGGPNAVSGTSQTASRTRVFAGAEVGRTWTLDTMLFDLSAYGRFVDIVDRSIGTLEISGGVGTSPASLQGVGESRVGGDAGLAATLRLSALTRLYAAYDGRFRSNFTSHSGVIGAEFRW
jgi:outer membrane autotransporter protein